MLLVFYDNRHHTQTLLYLANGTQPSPRQAQQLSILFSVFQSISINIRTLLNTFKECVGTITFRSTKAHRM